MSEWEDAVEGTLKDDVTRIGNWRGMKESAASISNNIDDGDVVVALCAIIIQLTMEHGKQLNNVEYDDMN